MTTSESDNDGIHSLWPTRFLKRQLPGTEAANQALLKLILHNESQHAKGQHAGDASLTTDYLSQNLLEIDDPAIKWLHGCINKTIIDYVKSQGLNYDLKWSIQAWANINRRGDYHNLHNHPHSYLSGTYYVAMPDDSSIDGGSRSDIDPGAISFYDPRPQANMTAIRQDSQVDPEFRVSPAGGMILLWPSFLHHFVHPNLSDQLRVSVSFNVVLKWQDSYLPQH